MNENEIVKEYKSGPVTVVWKPKKCIHSAICAKGLPGVFDPNKRPWINPDGATSKELMNQIDQCPSGALSYRLDEEGKSQGDNDTAQVSTKVQAFDAGPLSIPGPITLVYKGEEKTLDAKSIAFCRCGASSNKPFCDGTHKKIGFED